VGWCECADRRLVQADHAALQAHRLAQRRGQRLECAGQGITLSRQQDAFGDRLGGFFIISGFTIRMVTPAATFTPGPYAIERLSRLWSVALPAIVITCLLDALSYKLNPAYYSLHWGPYRYIGLHLIANTLFLTQNWGMDIAPLSNSPFWSLSYEAWFYLIFGLSMARRTLWVAIAAILAGPNIMYMMILWLTGVVSFDIFDRLRERRHLIATAAASALLALLLLTIYLRKFEAIGLIYDRLQRGIFGTFHISPRRSREDLIIPGLIAAPMFMAMLCTAKLVGRVVTIPPPVVRISRAAGVFTFPLYTPTLRGPEEASCESVLARL
jgi:peptidoglycan/LPS O-acetylase OafA/YrhL